jgi:uncharacterized protein
MMRLRAGLGLTLVAAISAGCSVKTGDPRPAVAISDDCEQDYLRLTGRVVDQADIVPPAREAQLSNELADLETRTRHQLVVATTMSLQGKAIEGYALCLANHWGIGHKKDDDGVLLLVAPTERKVRIEVGDGLENALTDDEAAVIIRDAILPQFKRGDYTGGIAAGADAIVIEIS